MDSQQRERLREVLTQQVSLYKEILVLSKKQSELIADGKILDLFPVFAEINRQMSKVQDLDATVVDAKEAWETDKGTLSAEERAPISALVEEVTSLLQEIISLEENQQNSIEEQKKRNRLDITKINRGQQMSKAYGKAYKPAPSTDSILDKRT